MVVFKFFHGVMKSTPVYFLLLFCINLVYFVDRGIIPGSSNEFNQFIARTLNTKNADVFLGMLQSSFIIGLLVSSLICGRLTHFYNPFLLVKVGTFIWMTSVLISALSFYTNSFFLLLLGRMLSGVGEGSFQCTMPPWIEANAPTESKSWWLSIFYTAIPVGTAAGYAYSASVSAWLDWPYAYWFEVIIMFPLLILLHLITRPKSTVKGRENSIQEQCFKSSNTSDSDLGGTGRDEIEYAPSIAEDYPLPNSASASSTNSKYNESEYDFCPDEEPYPRPAVPSMVSELIDVLSHPVFLCIAFGYAAQIASLNGLATFGSSLMMGLGYFETEAESSAAFGCVVSLAGLVGTPLGGLLLDRQTRLSRLRNESRTTALRSATSLITALNLVALCLLLLVGAIWDKAAFLLFVSCGCTFVFCSTTGIAIAILEAVTPSTRAFAMALVTVMIHILGDVPSPILVGLLKDTLAPDCVVGNAATSAACREQAPGLRVTIVVTVLWLGWTVLFFGLAWRLSVRKSKRTAALLVSSDDVGSRSFNEPLLADKVVV